MAAAEPKLQSAQGMPGKWAVAGIVMIGVFMTLLDTTIVDITLPKMLAELCTDTLGIQWVVITYMVGAAISMASAGWLGDRIGRKYTYILGMILFTISSMVCGQAWSLASMNTARLIQGLGEGLVVPIGMAILYKAFPEKEHGLAMGVYCLGASFAPALGPTLGGLLTEHFTWRWIFYVNLPTGLIGLFLAFTFLPRESPNKTLSAKFDLVGFALLTAWVSALIIFLAKGQEWEWLGSDLMLFLIAAFAVSLAAFIVWELRCPHPLTDLRLFRHSTFSLTSIIVFLFSITLYGGLFLLPLYMERLRLYPTLTSGLVFLPGSLAMGFGVIIGGILSDKWDARKTLIIGMVALTVTTYRLMAVDLYTDKYTQAFDLYLWWGASAGFILPAATLIGFSVLRSDEINMGSSLQNMSRLIAGSIGTSIVATLLERRSEAFFDSLTQGLTYANPVYRMTWQRIYNSLDQGLPAGPLFLRERSNELLQLYIQANASAYSFQSCFIYLAIFSAVGCLLLFWVKYEKNK
jgi:DHA2 family multidrug resistance protein